MSKWSAYKIAETAIQGHPYDENRAIKALAEMIEAYAKAYHERNNQPNNQPNKEPMKDKKISESTDLYELLKDYEDPSGTIRKGVRKTESQWMARFALLEPGDCKIKTDWFKGIVSSRNKFLKRIMTLGAELDNTENFIEAGVIINDAEKLYDKHFQVL